MATEKEAALAAVTDPQDTPTLFDKILNKEIPSTAVYEDDKVYAFRDICPQAPTHILIIPKVKDGLSQLSKAEERHCEILGHLMYTAKVIAKQEGLEDGFRVVINDGPSGCQSVYHLHVHLLGGRQMDWPPGVGSFILEQFALHDGIASIRSSKSEKPSGTKKCCRH